MLYSYYWVYIFVLATQMIDSISQGQAIRTVSAFRALAAILSVVSISQVEQIINRTYSFNTAWRTWSWSSCKASGPKWGNCKYISIESNMNKSSWKISFDEVQFETECWVRDHNLSTRTNTSSVVLAAILWIRQMCWVVDFRKAFMILLHLWWMMHFQLLFQLLKSLTKLEVGWHFSLGCRNRTKAIENRGVTCTVSVEQLERWHVCKNPMYYACLVMLDKKIDERDHVRNSFNYLESYTWK